MVMGLNLTQVRFFVACSCMYVTDYCFSFRTYYLGAESLSNLLAVTFRFCIIAVFVIVDL
jgi:hypothetical protein